MTSTNDVDTYLLDMELSSCGEASPYRDVVREHSVEFVAMDYDDERKLIGRAHLHTLNTLTSRDPLMHLDEISNELVTLGHAALYAGEEKLDGVSPCAQTYGEHLAVFPHDETRARPAGEAWNRRGFPPRVHRHYGHPPVGGRGRYACC